MAHSLTEKSQEGGSHSFVPKIIELGKEGTRIRDLTVYLQPSLLWVSAGRGDRNPFGKCVSGKSSFSPPHIRIESRLHDHPPPCGSRWAIRMTLACDDSSRILLPHDYKSWNLALQGTHGPLRDIHISQEGKTEAQREEVTRPSLHIHCLVTAQT